MEYRVQHVCGLQKKSTLFWQIGSHCINKFIHITPHGGQNIANCVCVRTIQKSPCIALHMDLSELTFSSHLCQGSWLWPDVLSWGCDASSCTLSETLGTPVLALPRHANTCVHMVACCLTLLGQQESLERQAMAALQDTIWHMLTLYSH